MNLNLIESKILALENLLYPHHHLWQNEILDLFLQNKLPRKWLDESFLLTLEEMQYLEETGTLPAKHPWYQLSLDLFNACKLPILNETVANEFIHKEIKEKKIHEINQLLFFSKKFTSFQSNDHLIDLAGGKGHLSFAFQDFYSELQLRRTVIDNNFAFNSTKTFNQDRNFSNQFRCLDLLKNQLLDVNDCDHLLLLHGCGELSEAGIDILHNHLCKSLHLVGCCYHLIKSSIKFQHYPLIVSNQALHLATKTHREINSTSWNKRSTQKHYRYSFGIWFEKKYQIPLPALKSSPSQLYRESFLIYAKEQLKRLKILATDEILNELQNCYRQYYDEIQKLIQLGALRMIFSRPIEVYIGLIRAQRILRSNNYNVLLGEIFNKKKSPRNILLFVSKK